MSIITNEWKNEEILNPKPVETIKLGANNKIPPSLFLINLFNYTETHLKGKET